MTIHEALSAAYCLPNYLLLYEVRDATGFDGKRSADAIAISLYRSRGQYITGFEFKQSRSDWLRELKDPDKAEKIGKFCDYFYLVTTDNPNKNSSELKIANMEEIPPSWGWIATGGKRLKTIKVAEKLPSVPLDRSMLCSLLYAAKERFSQENKKSLDALVGAGVRDANNQLQRDNERLTEQNNKLERSIQQFEDASGVSIRWGDCEKIGAAVRLVLSQKDIVQKFESELDFCSKRAHAVAREIDLQLERLQSDQRKPNAKAVTA